MQKYNKISKPFKYKGTTSETFINDNNNLL